MRGRCCRFRDRAIAGGHLFACVASLMLCGATLAGDTGTSERDASAAVFNEQLATGEFPPRSVSSPGERPARATHDYRRLPSRSPSRGPAMRASTLANVTDDRARYAALQQTRNATLAAGRRQGRGRSGRFHLAYRSHSKHRRSHNLGRGRGAGLHLRVS